IDEQSYESSSLRDAIAESGEHPLFETQIRFFLSESFFEDLIHSFGLLMSFAACRAVEKMRVKRASFRIGELSVKICREPVVNFVVNGCHIPSPLKREWGEVVSAAKPARGRGFRAARRWSA